MKATNLNATLKNHQSKVGRFLRNRRGRLATPAPATFYCTIAALLALALGAAPATAADPERIPASQLVIGHKLTFSLDTTARGARFAIPGTSMKAPENAMFWRLVMEDGLRETTAFSDAQSGTASLTDGVMRIHYDSIKALDGAVYDVALDIEVREENGMLSFQTTVENKDKRLRVSESQCPILEATALCGPKKEDVLYMSHAEGRRVANPWERLRDHTTQYLANDEKEITWAVSYPRGSMAWMGVETGGNFLYVGRHDDKIRNCIFIARRDAPHLPEKLALTVAHMPAARTGEKVPTAPVTIGLLPGGDWRAGAATYRAWAEKSFYKPVKKEKWVHEMNGWQRIILRSQYGVDYYTFDDLPRLHEIGKKHGIDSLFLFGWWTEGMDFGYPEYNMTPESKKKLRENIKKVQDAGGHVILVCNANYVDPRTEYYKKHGDDVIRIDMNGNQYLGEHGYSEYGVMRRLYGARQFRLVCYGAKEWREQLLRQGGLMKEFSPHCLFYDILGASPHTPCFNDKHDHGPRIDEDWVTRRIVYEQLVNLCGKDVFATEITVDIAAAYCQFIHSNDGFSPRDHGDRYFPQMFRQTFPEVIISNRGARDESPGFERNLKFAFMMGMRFDVEIFRCRGNLDDAPAYAKLVAELNQKRLQYKDFLIYGKFSLSDRNILPAGLHCTEYESSNGKQRLRILYNRSAKPLKHLDITLKPDEMRFDIFDK